jgi:N-acetylneuraminate synthase/N,N'-diacetyllegionaminate synthase
MTGFAPRFELGGHAIGPGAPCLVIAEAGVNHFGDMAKARRLVELAADSGADVFKTQHFKTDRLVGPASPEWRERLRPKEMPDAAIAEMHGYCKQRGITFLCTAHDKAALDFLDRELDVCGFKIGSGEVENWPFLADVAGRGKPVILSTGMYTLEQVDNAVAVIAEAGCRELAVLHCITSYPTDPAIVNLGVMERIRAFFPGPVGYSDHTAGTAVPLAAVALGAEVIEKHITIDRDVAGAQDWKVSCDASSMPRFVADIREVEAALGGGSKVIGEGERESMLWARKSLTAATGIAAGTRLRPEHLLAQRPGTGISPAHIDEVVGRPARRAIAAGEPLTEDMLE